MICYECMEHIDPKIKDSYKILSADKKMFVCNCCYEGIRFKELVLKSGLSKGEKLEMFGYKRIMDVQNKKIQSMLLKLFKLTGINMFT